MSEPCYNTIDDARPCPTRSVVTACEYLVETVDKDMGTKNGKTALYWHLIWTIQQHAGHRPGKGPKNEPEQRECGRGEGEG